jgi:hypothetical protein
MNHSENKIALKDVKANIITIAIVLGSLIVITIIRNLLG